MTPEQALQMLVAASERALLSKIDHINLERAAQVLRDLVEKAEADEKARK